MIYHLFDYLSEAGIDFPGIGLMQYISFRALVSLMTALLVALYLGPKIIRKLQLKQIGEDIRDLGLEGQMQKKRHSYHGWNYNNPLHSCPCPAVR